MADDFWDISASATLRVSRVNLRRLLPSAFEGAGYDKVRIQDDGSRAFAERSTTGRGHYQTNNRTRAELRWRAVSGHSNVMAVAWNVFDTSQAEFRPRVDLADRLGESLRQVVDDWLRQRGVRKREAPPRDKVVGPNETFDGNYTGTLRDYSGCAGENELRHLSAGVLPLGRYAFGFDVPPRKASAPLYLSRFRNGGRMEFNGVLICAPQNSGKTTLLERWAEAATRAPKPYAIFAIDVKGNLRQKLQERKLAGDIYLFSTDPAEEQSDRINFLDGPTGLTPAESDRIRQLATALLPSRGFTEHGGLDEYHYRNRVIWLTAFIHLLKLEQCYYPERFVDTRGRERNVDLADLYELVASEERLYALLADLSAGEKVLQRRGSPLPVCGVEHWAEELSILLDPKRVSVGQRPERDSFRSYTTGILTALEPFARHGTLHQRVRSFGPGRLFDLEAALSGGQRPVTVIFAARQQDLEKADAVLAMAIKRLQWLLFDRMQQADAEDRPVLLLLDETRRIRDFNPSDYVAFAREAKAACVIVYQALDQIGEPGQITALLENVGTQIYLGSLVGNTAKYFASILPKRSREVVTRQIVQAADSETVTQVFGREQVDYLSTVDLYHLPAGEWPALVYINDQPRRKPFLTDMTDAARPVQLSKPREQATLRGSGRPGAPRARGIVVSY
jgi:hypothetical protein